MRSVLRLAVCMATVTATATLASCASANGPMQRALDPSMERVLAMDNYIRVVAGISGDASRFVPVNRFRTPLRHRAKTAAPGADIAQQHEGRGVMVPAFSNVRTLRRLAHRMQPKPARQLLQVMEVVARWSLRLEPRGLGARDPGADFNLDELRRGGH